MNRFFATIIFLIIFMSGSAQKVTQPKLDPIDNKKMSRQIDSSMKQLDSINLRLNDGYKKTMDSVNNHLEQARNERNLDEFMAMQKESEAKQKRSMWIRLFLGGFFLIVLIVGLLRKKKKTA